MSLAVSAPKTNSAVQIIEASAVALTTLAALPQTLGPFADILPEKYKVTIITVGLCAITACKGMNAIWPLLVRFFPGLGPEPGALAQDAQKPLPVLPAEAAPPPTPSSDTTLPSIPAHPYQDGPGHAPGKS